MNLSAEPASTITNRTQSVSDTYYIIPRYIDTLVNHVIYLGIIPFLSVSGITLNSVCCLMFFNLRKKSSTVVMLIALAASDIFILIIGCFYTLMSSSESFGIPFSLNTITKLTPYIQPYVLVVPSRIGNTLTLFISIERLLSVLLPLQIRRYSTSRNACIVVIISYILPLVLCSPNLFYLRTEDIYLNSSESYLTVLKPTEFLKHFVLANTINTAQEVVFRFIPVFGVMITSIITWSVVQTNARQRLKMTDNVDRNRRQSQESKVTRTLLVITLIFVLCKLPITILRMIIFIDVGGDLTRPKNNIYNLVSSITFVFLILNSVINFFIYYKTSSVYNAEFKKLFACYNRANTQVAEVYMLSTSSGNDNAK